jgi:predicted DNA-binding transcriptional regulator AlpA
MHYLNSGSIKDGLPAGVLSVEDVAKSLHCSERWVYRLCNEHKLIKAYYPKRKRSVGILASSIDKFITS